MEEQIKLLMQMNQMLAAQNERLSALLEKQAVEIQRQSEKIDELLQRIDDLTHKKNSRNSSVPPSSDGYSKPAPKSQRESTGAKPGGQTGHKGSSMKLMKEPDEVREHYPDMCAGCPNRGSCHSRIAERRYETDIVVESRLVEHRQMVCCCPMCNNKEITGAFPDNGICCAHLQRELVYADEQMKQSWAKPLHDLLSEILHRRKELEAQGGTAFSEEEWNGFSVRYNTLIRQGFCENPIPEKVKGKRGRPGKGKIVCLLERFRDYKEDILRFATDWKVPFTNNEAERSIRFSKVKQKVSGCFRTEDGAKDYMQIMSYISSCRKHGIGYFEAVRTALAGNALTLVSQWG